MLGVRSLIRLSLGPFDRRGREGPDPTAARADSADLDQFTFFDFFPTSSIVSSSNSLSSWQQLTDEDLLYRP